jgi:hypothetical protein
MRYGRQSRPRRTLPQQSRGDTHHRGVDEGRAKQGIHDGRFGGLPDVGTANGAHLRPDTIQRIAMEDKHIDFACPYCGRRGNVVWRGDGAERELVRLSGGFHVEAGRLPGAPHVIICSACDEIDPSRSLKL